MGAIELDDIPKTNEIWKWSDPTEVKRKAKLFLGKNLVFLSTKPGKKYMTVDPNTNKWVHFGDLGYEDFRKHKDQERRERYLARATKIAGNWKYNKFSPNALSIHLLW